MSKMINIEKHLTYLRALLMSRRLVKNYPFERTRIKDLQFQKLKKLLIYSYNNIPFYHDRMDAAGFSPFAFKRMEEFQKIPVLTKNEYREFVNSVLEAEPHKYEDWFEDGTSGSTGTPLKVIRTWKERAYIIAKWLRPMFLNGYSFRHKTFSLPPPHREVKRDSLLQSLGIGRRINVPYSESAENMVREYIRAEPDFLYAGKSHLLLMAREIGQKNISIKKPRYYAVTSETLDENSKAVIQTVFGDSNMYEVYGAIELGGNLGFQIKGTSGLHFCHDTNILELDNNGSLNQEQGACIITDLYTWSFPLIRYRLGDWIEMEPSVGDTMPVIKKIIGREDDWILLPDGQKLPLHADIYDIMIRRNEIVQFRIIQEDVKSLKVQIVLADEGLKEAVENKLTEDLKKYISPQMEYRFEFLKEILPDPNGKIRMVVNKLEDVD